MNTMYTICGQHSLYEPDCSGAVDITSVTCSNENSDVDDLNRARIESLSQLKNSPAETQSGILNDRCIVHFIGFSRIGAEFIQCAAQN